MDKNLLEKIDPHIDDVADKLTQLMDGPALETLRQKLADLSRELAPYSVTLEWNLRTFDADREQSLPLLQCGLASSNGEEPYQVSDDASLTRYVVDGNMAVVPHDHCPRCWSRWGFKEENLSCPSCAAEMGADVKLLIDSDCCPHCENGTVTGGTPECTECGFNVNPAHVSWG